MGILKKTFFYLTESVFQLRGIHFHLRKVILTQNSAFYPDMSFQIDRPYGLNEYVGQIFSNTNSNFTLIEFSTLTVPRNLIGGSS